MKELAVQFGPASSLVGVVTLPSQQSSSRVALLLLNAGIIHRVGARRLSVKIARAVAAQGVTAFRFDFSGVGDSPTATTPLSLREQTATDVTAAIDHLQREHGIERVLLFGICSGAVNAFWAALADRRVVGLMMVDGYWYRTRLTGLVRRWRRLRAATWREVAAAVVNKLRRRGGSPSVPAFAAGLIGSSTDMTNPPRAQFVAALDELVERRVSVFFLYSGSVLEYFSYAGQFRDAFGKEAFFPRTRCMFDPSLDHTATTLASQQKLIGTVTEWVRSIPPA
jgi:pimeloyl-ACP methyl ester carboxylesterase